MAARKPSIITIDGQYAMVKPNNSDRLHKFDLDMLHRISGHAWRENDAGYLITSKWTKKGGFILRASHLVLGRPKGNMQVDHKDRDRTNVTRENLRYSTPSQNNANRSTRVSIHSGFRGVWWNKTHQKWAGRICKDGKKHNLGYSDDPAEMAKIYDAKAVDLFGEFALTNSMLGLYKNCNGAGN
jgi:hypothetical protein